MDINFRDFQVGLELLHEVLEFFREDSGLRIACRKRTFPFPFDLGRFFQGSISVGVIL